MPPQSASKKHRTIMLVIMGQSPYNRSIWTGFYDGLRLLGHTVDVVDATCLPDPGSLATRPDLLFAIHGGNVPVTKIHAYRDVGIATAVYLLDEPYEVDQSVQWSQHYDCVFTVDKATIPVHQTHTRAAHLPLAYNHTLFGPEGPAIPARILVLGTLFAARQEYLAAVRDRWGALVTWVGPGWKHFSPRGEHYEGFVDPAACARFYRGADIVINIHRDSFWSHFGDLNRNRIEATHLNPRFWEVAGCHTFQLCSYRQDIDVLAPAAITFDSVESLLQKIDYFLENGKAREDFATRVYRRTRRHTYQHRSQTVLDTLGLA